MHHTMVAKAIFYCVCSCASIGSKYSKYRRRAASHFEVVLQADQRGTLVVDTSKGAAL